jgi:archaeal flagellar protein FlaI
MVDKDPKKKPAQEPAPPAVAPAKPEAHTAKTSLVARARGETPPAPPVQEGQARQIGNQDATKQSLHVTKDLDPKEREKALRSAISEKVSPAGVIKLPEFDAPKATQPMPAKSETITVMQPPGAAPGTPPAPGQAQAPATAGAQAPAAPGAKPAEPGKDGKEPAKEEPDPLEEKDPLPLLPDDKQIDYYPILEPYAYVQIVYNEHEKETKYRVIEPPLTKEERKILHFVEQTLVDVLDAPPEELEGKTLQQFLRGKFEEVLYDYAIVLGDEESEEEKVKDKLLYYIFRDFIGEGRIDTIMRDPMIEDVSCDGPHQPIFLYHRKYESIKSNVKFRDDDELDSFVIRMAQRSGKHVSIAEPILDATMVGGSRLQATLSHEVSAHGSTFTIRKFRDEPFTPPDLVRFGTQSAEMLAYWWIAIQNAASAIYAGGTASGKTTSLNAILLFIPPQMKIVSIEDTRELSLPHPNWIAGITRSGFGPRDESGRQAGEIDMFQLLKNALRQRPEYIIVGEVRGKEAFSLFQAMATGHAAYGTMHADSVDAVIHRLESDPINIPRSLLEALDIISIQIQTRVGGRRVRRSKQLAEIVGLDPHTHEILTNEVFRWVPKDDSFKFSGVSYILERIQVEKGISPDEMRIEIENRVEIIKYMIKRNVRNFKDVGRLVAGYYKDPKTTMEKVRKDEAI